ncbi:MAG: hypothetical protein K2V38_16615 [Gemmataceae bacterium]|nr:hypothetical protein [Gemmataceae bacterium]
MIFSPGASGGVFYADTFNFQQLGLTGIKIFGEGGEITGFQNGGNFAGNPITVEFRGYNTETVAAGQAIGTDIDLRFVLDGGDIRVLNTFVSYTDQITNNSVTGGTDYGSGGAFPDSGGNFSASFVTSALPINYGFSNWVFRMQFEFLNTFNAFLIVRVPNNSVDIRVIPTPSAAVGLLLISGLAARRRRTR